MTRWVDEFKHIQSRADFFVALGESVRRTHELLRRAPGDPYVLSILRQLEAIERWTAHGRDPTREERKSLTIGQILVRELEPAQTDELEDWIQLVREVKGYFEEWLDDATFQRIDADELNPFD